MPLTFSHPAIILPAKYLPERWVSMTGLIIGSVTPDFEYFMRMKVESIYSHTWTGMFWFDLPLSLLLTFLYHNIIRNQFICNAPGFLKKRLLPYISFNWVEYLRHNFLKVLICLLIGIASHIFWDAFTHPHGDFVKLTPFLKQSTLLMGYPVVNSRILQYISTIIGTIVVFYAIMQMPRNINSDGVKNQAYYWPIIMGTALGVTGLRIFAGGTRHINYYAIGPSIVSGLIIGAVGAFLLLSKKEQLSQ